MGEGGREREVGSRQATDRSAGEMVEVLNDSDGEEVAGLSHASGFTRHSVGSTRTRRLSARTIGNLQKQR